MITQMELAQLVGVSQKTVNRALSEHADVSEATRRRIKQLAEEHGYIPNQAAKVVRQGAYKCIGLIQPVDIYQSYLPVELFSGLKQSLLPHDLNLTISCFTDDELTDSNFVGKLQRQMMCDGLLVNYISLVPSRLAELIDRFRLPAVWLNCRRESDCVYHDETEAGAEATRHLLELGHRRIAYVNGSGCRHHSRVDRRQGYLDAMRQAGLAPLMLETPEEMKYEDVCSWYDMVLRDPATRPTAVVTYLRGLYSLFYKTAELGIKIPRDISVITFNTNRHQYLGYDLTTLVQDENLLSAMAVKMLLKKLRHRQLCREEAVPLNLEKGATTAAVSGAAIKN